MVFSSTVFLFLFFPIVCAIYYLLARVFKSISVRNVFLLLASLLFYAWGEPLFVFLLIFSIIVTWWLGLKIETGKSKAYMIIGICYHVSILFVFKYLSFLTSEIGKLSENIGAGLRIGLPIGISFFTFQMMSYLLDVYNKRTAVQKNILYLGLYVSFFPQLIAGPIVRYSTIEKEIVGRKESVEDFEMGIRRFIVGLGKKVLLADYLALSADNIFALSRVSDVGMITAWFGAVCYTLEIYFDFSGYSDMAIGLGRCFGFRFDENFKRPYSATSVRDFWKRWHISLTDWFRQYVYIPLGGNRGVCKRL